MTGWSLGTWRVLNCWLGEESPSHLVYGEFSDRPKQVMPIDMAGVSITSLRFFM